MHNCCYVVFIIITTYISYLVLPHSLMSLPEGELVELKFGEADMRVLPEVTA
jgi:hypothetical protein